MDSPENVPGTAASYASPFDAVVHALVLSVTAPTQEQSERALTLAEELIAAGGLSENDVEVAKRRAEAILGASSN